MKAASVRQIEAADPQLSTWLSANAGSGKTRVLIDRVVRLLFAGTPPQRILCLTYTKAAASEMQNRLFALLGAWAMKPADELRNALSELGSGTGVGADELARARRLFAQAIESPGGLRIQTIHSFCAGLLRRFPLEAGVPPGFTEMDDRQARYLLMDVLEDIASGPQSGLLDALAYHTGDEGIVKLIGEICRNRVEFSRGSSQDALALAAGLEAGMDADAILSRVFLGGEAALVSALDPILRAGKTTDVKTADALMQARVGTPDLAGLARLESTLLSGDKATLPYSAKIGTVPTKAVAGSMPPDLLAELEGLMCRVEAARDARCALAALERSRALHDFAAAFLPKYDARKADRGLLDFDDLIHGAARLLTDHSVAQWVLYRLDGGLDHILVDEAQDTSPTQWTVIERLSEELMSGRGVRTRDRTLFVVGDKKQSIYSFQGANLVRFDQIRENFRSRLEPQGQWQALELEHSFRSAPVILDLVDRTFTADLLPSLGGRMSHVPYYPDKPGRVDLWPAEDKVDVEEPADHYTAEFHDREPDANHRLAKKVASEIGRIIADGTTVHTRAGVKAVDEGDILILVRRRSRLFYDIIRACKAAGLAVAGTDRLRLNAEIAARDLTALLRFLALPEDNLSLATALRSPLFGWSEAELFRLAAKRPEKAFLWAALREKRADHPETLGILDDLLNRAEYLRPFELLHRALTRHGMRRKLLARLGPEAEEGIDELLNQTLAYERSETPSLTGFLVWSDIGTEDISRRFDSGARALRVMTVHGAKGLEAPIVILPDTAKPAGGSRSNDNILVGKSGTPMWRVPAAEAPPPMAALIAERKRQQQDENLRLLYVAMTRAESWLIVAAAGETGVGPQSWYGLIADGMAAAGAAIAEPPIPGIPGMLRVQNGTWPASANRTADMAIAARPAIPDWLLRPAPAVSVDEPVLTPSSLPGAKALVGEAGLDEETAMRIGASIHLLLEHLPAWPESDWNEVAQSLLGGPGDLVTSAEIDTVLHDVGRILAAAANHGGPGTAVHREVPVSGRLPEVGNARMRGTIDVLSVSPDVVSVLDYKTNRVVPSHPEEVPEGILRQMGAYASLMAQVYPGHRIETAILWTATGTIMPLPLDIVRKALASTPIP